MTEKPYLITTNALQNEDVFNSHGEHLGKIENLIVDLDHNCIAFGVFSFGGILGLGEKHFAIPWKALKFNKDTQQYILNIDKEQLEGTEGFTANNYPDMSDPMWRAQLYAYYGYPPYWTTPSFP